MAMPSIFGDRRDEIRLWLVLQSKEAQEVPRSLYLNELRARVRTRYKEFLPPLVYKVDPKTGKKKLSPEEGREAARNLVGFASVLHEIQAGQERKAAEKVGKNAGSENLGT